MSTSASTSSSPVTRMRITGIILIISGFLLNTDVVAWLVGPDKSSVLAQAIMALQGILLAGGFLLLIMPTVFDSKPAVQNLITAGALVAFLATVTGTVGMVISPPIDYRYPTYPESTCEPTNAFCNRSAEAGIKDIMRYGKGAAIADINNDGWMDLFAADAENRDNEDWGVSTFYLNNGDGTFTATDIGIHEEDLLSSWAASFADLDNDGDQDVVLTGGGYAGVGRLAVYENRMQEEGRFVSITESAGLGEYHEGKYRWWGVAWADYDNDADLDFAISRVYGKVILFRNNGDSTFSDVTEEMGIQTRRARDRDGKNIVWFDYDYDGDQDLYYAGIHAHMFYRNDGEAGFTDVTDDVFGGNLPKNWVYPSDSPVVFSAAALDVNQDGFDDLYIGRQIEQEVVLFNDGKGNFTMAARELGLDAILNAKNNESKPLENTMGLGVGDLFDDGWPDVIVGSGDPVRADLDVVFCNKEGRFERCTEVLRSDLAGPFRTRTHGIALGDVNNDGYTDVFQSLGGHAPWDQKTDIDSREYAALLVAQPQGDVNTAVLTLEGVSVNRDAIGARIKVTAEETHYYTVRSTQAFQSQNDRRVIVTLGGAEEGVVEVSWGDGSTDVVKVEAGGRYLVKQGDESGM